MYVYSQKIEKPNDLKHVQLNVLFSDIIIDKARYYYTNDMKFLNIITDYYLLLYFTDIIGNVA
jgi:hypothetical protein